MIKTAVIFAEGTEEVEAITPVDVLRRAGIKCDIISIDGNYVKGSHKITVKSDLLAENFDMKDYDGIIIPGGMPGAVNIAGNPVITKALEYAFLNSRLVAAICASPAVVLAANGFIKGKKATCYPSDAFIGLMKNAQYTAEDVTTDGNLITADGPKSAMKFSMAICEYFGVKPAF